MSTFADGVFQYGGQPVGGNWPIPRGNGRAWFVDGTNGLDGNSGRKPSDAFASIGQAVEDNPDLEEGDVIYIFPKIVLATATDPSNYAETFIITKPHISLIGVGSGPAQGAIPQIKIGAGTTAMCTVRAPCVTIQGLGFNGGDSTGGGIKIDDNGGTKNAWGTIIRGCHFKNCKVHATQGTAGGAIYWPSDGGGWQIRIEGNRFYKNVADIVMAGTSLSRPQDVVIQNNIFGGPAGSVTCNIYAAADGIDGLIIDNNVFTALPALSSGNVNLFVFLTGSVGILSNNVFACTGKTFGVAGDNGGTVPATVFLVNNYQEDGTTQIARTS
jgi:hypothetical protein